MSEIHTEPHPLAGKTVKLANPANPDRQNMVLDGALYRIEDYWDRVTGGSWMWAEGNPAALHYAMRTGLATTGTKVPVDDEVVYGHIGRLGHLVHVSELGEVQP